MGWHCDACRFPELEQSRTTTTFSEVVTRAIRRLSCRPAGNLQSSCSNKAGCLGPHYNPTAQANTWAISHNQDVVPIKIAAKYAV
jgi:hypothetical protein